MSTCCRLSAPSKPNLSEFALGPVVLQIQNGEFGGISGRSSSDQTKLVLFMVGALRPASGSMPLWELNHESNAQETKERIGSVDEEPVIYDWMKPSDLERFPAPKAERTKRDLLANPDH